MSGALGVQSQLVARRCVEAVVTCFSNEKYVTKAYQATYSRHGPRGRRRCVC